MIFADFQFGQFSIYLLSHIFSHSIFHQKRDESPKTAIVQDNANVEDFWGGWYTTGTWFQEDEDVGESLRNVRESTT